MRVRLLPVTLLVGLMASTASVAQTYDNPEVTASCYEDCREVRRWSFYGGVDLTILKPHINVPIPLGDYDPAFAPRFYLGIANWEALGARVSYWSFDNDFATDPDLMPPGSTIGLTARALDLEVTQSARLARWDFLIGGGLRWAESEFSTSIPGGPALQGLSVQGVGPTASLAARRPLGCSGVSLVGDTRLSMLFGSSTTTFILPLSNADNSFATCEIRMGAEWERQFGPYTAKVGGFFEAQQWQDATINVVTGFGNPANLGFFGPTFRLEIRR